MASQMIPETYQEDEGTMEGIMEDKALSNLGILDFYLFGIAIHREVNTWKRSGPNIKNYRF